MGNEKDAYCMELGRDNNFLQAIVVADSFDEKFRPITMEKPRSLLPIVNRCMIDYTIEMLCASGIRQILVIARNHADQIRHHLLESRYSKDNEISIQLLTVKNCDCLTLGDAIRELDRDYKSLLQGEFVIVNGFLVGQTDLTDLLIRHLQRKDKDDSIVMTAIFTKYPKGHHTRQSNSDLLVVADPKTNAILHLEQQNQSDSFVVPLKCVSDYSRVDIQYDLCFTGIYFADIRVPQLFGDNFDFQNMNDFLNNILEDDLIDKKICYDIILSGYVGTVWDMKLYHSISSDIISRWTYPSVPDLNGYTYHPKHIYLGNGVDIARTANIKSFAVVGHNSVIGEGTTINRSVIGSRCKIGRGVTIINSHIWDGAVIEDDCIIDNSIICNEVVVRSGCELNKGCILSFGVIVGPRVVLPKLTIVYVPRKQTNNTCSSLTIVDVGDECNGCIYPIDEYEMDLYLWGELCVDKEKPSSEDDEENSNRDTSASGEAEARVSELDNFHCFYFEALDSVRVAVFENVPFENTIAEINASKHVHNISVEDMNRIIIEIVVELIFPESDLQEASLLDSIQDKFEHCGSFCKRYFSAPTLLMEYINYIEDFVFSHAELKPRYPNIIYELYFNDIIDKNFLESWLITPTPDNIKSPEVLQTRTTLVRKLLQSLQQSSDSEVSEGGDSED